MTIIMVSHNPYNKFCDKLDLNKDNSKIILIEMNKFKTIYRPIWTLQKARKLNKLWLDKNENTHPKLLKLYENILKTLILFTFQLIRNLEVYTKKFLLENLPTKNIIFSHGSDGCIKNIFETL